MAQPAHSLPDLWARHRPFLRRLLLSLTGDLDLAEDLLQDSYVRAHQGFAGYRGGDARAWLAAVAKSAFYDHARRRPYRSDELALDDGLADELPSPGSTPHIEALAIRTALAGLGPDLRLALMMRHYAGLSYEEIARRTACPVGTAKWRVSAAVGRLRSLVGEGPAAGACRGAALIEYLYGALGGDRQAALEQHLERCPRCQARLAEIRQVLRALDLVEGERKMMHLLELAADGAPSLYVRVSALNEDAKPERALQMHTTVGELRHWLAQGRELRFRKWQDPVRPAVTHYRARLPRPLPPGERVEYLGVMAVPPELAARPLQPGRYRFTWRQRPSRELEWAYVQTLRLPAGAELLAAAPEPREVRRRGQTTTLLWAAVLAPAEHFACDIEYTLNS